MLFLFLIYRGHELIEQGIAKVTHPSVTTEEILAQVNQTAEALKKPKKFWSESDESDMEGMCIENSSLITFWSFLHAHFFLAF